MELNYSQIFNSRVLDQIKSYCTLNNIEDVDKFISNCFTQGFNIEKYGLLGKTLNEGEKHLKTDVVEEKWVEKEVIVEKRVEVPVEVIKEVEKIVEKIVEVPVEVIREKIIEKEIPVEKIVTKIEYICDKEGENELLLKIQQLETEMSKKDKSLDELRRNLDEALDKPPVEIIKEVEVIREVEKPNDKAKMLSETLMKLKGQLSEKDGEIEKLNNTIKQLESRLNPTGAIYMKGSNINENL